MPLVEGAGTAELGARVVAGAELVTSAAAELVTAAAEVAAAEVAAAEVGAAAAEEAGLSPPARTSLQKVSVAGRTSSVECVSYMSCIMRQGGQKHTESDVGTASANDAGGGSANKLLLLLADALVVLLGGADLEGGLVNARKGALGDDGDILGGGDGHEGSNGDSGVLHFELGCCKVGY